MNTEFSINVPGIGKVDVVRQYDGMDKHGKREQFFWDLFDEDGFCLNEGCPFWTIPTKEEIVNFLIDQPDED